MKQSRRSQKVSGLIHAELNRLLSCAVEDPRLVGVFVTEVEVSVDLRLARAYFTATDPKQAEKGLSRASHYFRRHLGDTLDLRFVPELKFLPDENATRARALMGIFDEIGHAKHP